MVDIYKSKFTGQEIDDILTNASNVTNIEANPSGEATEELTKITIGDTVYSIPEGVVIEGNPSGDATVELTKLKIGDIIYSIPQGSGGEVTRGWKLSGRSGYPSITLPFVQYADGTNATNVTVSSSTTLNNVVYFEVNQYDMAYVRNVFWFANDSTIASARYGEVSVRSGNVTAPSGSFMLGVARGNTNGVLLTISTSSTNVPICCIPFADAVVYGSGA